jgi:hypothetical protein
VGALKNRLSKILYTIRNPEYDERDKEYNKKLGIIRIMILLPFIIAAIIVFLMSLE